MANDEFYNEVDLYLEARLLPKDPVLDDVIGAQDAAGLPPMAVSPLQGAFLKMLANMIAFMLAPRLQFQINSATLFYKLFNIKYYNKYTLIY